MPTQRDEITKLERHPTAISRIQTGRSQYEGTIAADLRSRTATTQSKTPMPNFGAGKPFSAPLPDREEYVVEFDGPNDHLHAQNWLAKKKIPIAVLLSFTIWVSSFGSAAWSPAITAVAKDYHISSEVGILDTSLFALRFATGPSLYAKPRFKKQASNTILRSIAGAGFPLFATYVSDTVDRRAPCEDGPTGGEDDKRHGSPVGGHSPGLCFACTRPSSSALPVERAKDPGEERLCIDPAGSQSGERRRQQRKRFREGGERWLRVVRRTVSSCSIGA